MAGRTDLEALVFQMDADINKLSKATDKALAKVNGSAGAMQGRFDKLGKELDKSFGGANIGHAAADALSELRGKLLSTTGDIPGLTGGLGKLGIAGLAVAAGVGAAIAVMDRTEKAVEFGASIAVLAKTLGVSTDFLQEFNFAAKQNEIDTGKADEGIKALNESLGAVQANLPRAKQLMVTFQALGLSPEQLRGFKDAGELFPVLADRISKVSSAAERAAIAKKLGIQDLIPLLNAGANGFNSLAQRARDLGIVMDASTVKKAEEAKQKLTELNQIMQDKANIQFAQFAQTLVTIKTAFADAELAGLKFLAAITGTQSPLDTIKEYTDRLHQLRAQDAHDGFAGGDPAHSQQYRDIAAKLRAATDQLHQQQKDNASIEAENAKGSAAATQLVPTKAARGGKGSADTGENAPEVLDEAQKAMAEAMAALTTNIGKHAEFEIAAVNDDLKKKTEAADAEIAKINADKALTAAKKQQLVGELEQAKLSDQIAAGLKTQKIQRDAAQARDEQTLKDAEDVDKYYQQIASISAKMAITAADRYAIEKNDLAIRQRLEREALATENAKMVADDPTRAGQANVNTKSLLDLQAAQRQQLAYDNQGPLGQYAAELQKTAGDTNTAFQNLAVTGLKDMNTQLAEAIAKGGTMHSVFTNMLTDLKMKLIELGIEKYITLPLAQMMGLGNGATPGTAGNPVAAGGSIFTTLGHALGFFADGTDSAPGGLAIVGEKGPELVNLPRGSQVVPNAKLASLGAPPPAGRVSYTQSLSFDMRGAVVTQDLLDQMQTMVARSQRQANMGSVVAAQGARAATMNDIQLRQRNSIP